MTRRRLLAALTVVAVLATACGGDDGDADRDDAAAPTTAPITTAAAPATTSPPTTATPTTDAPPTTAAPTTASATTAPPTTEAPEPVPEWEIVPGTEDCVCADGSDYIFWVREADPAKVVFYLEGGGACWSAESCSFTDGTYDPDVDPNDPREDPNNFGGIFNFDNPLNPLRDHSFVFVPYCSGDGHLGNAVTDYGDGMVVRHNGFVNANTALAEAVDRFGGATEVVVAGTSAGSAAAPLYGGLAADAFGDASIAVLADASGAYPSVPGINAAFNALYGADTVLPDWPVNEGLTAEDWGPQALFIQAGLHAPRIRFGRYDNAFDSTQEFYAALVGYDASRIDELMALNEANIEAAGVNQASYTAPGQRHGILYSDSMYYLEVEGVAFLDWLTRVLQGEEVDDVTCVDCS